MAKKPSLTEALTTAGKTEKTEAHSAPTPEKHTKSRVGKKLIAGHFDPAIHQQLKQLSVNQNTSIQALLGEALNDLFEKHGVAE